MLFCFCIIITRSLDITQFYIPERNIPKGKCGYQYTSLPEKTQTLWTTTSKDTAMNLSNCLISYKTPNSYSCMNISKTITINNTFISDSSFQYTTNSSRPLIIVMANTIVQNTVLILRNTIIFKAIDSTFENTTFSNIVTSNDSQSYVEIVLDGCKFLSLCDTGQPTNYVTLNTISIVKLFILHSTVRCMQIHIAAYNLFLFVQQSKLYHSTIIATVKSHLRIPSFIYLKHSQFNNNRNVLMWDNEILYKLDNPYVHIMGCKFFGISLEITSVQHTVKRQIFYVEIMQSLFEKISKYRDGGALYLYSDIKLASVKLFNATFTRNIAKTNSEINHGKGGAVFAGGNSMLLVIEYCRFYNNYAHESGDALYTTKDVILSIIESYFEMHMTKISVHPILNIFGTVNTLQAVFKINYMYWDIVAVGKTVMIVSSISEEMKLFISCPQWHVHVLKYSLVSLDGFTGSANQSQRILSNIVYECGVCERGMYSVSRQNNIITYPGNFTVNQNTSLIEKHCVDCPYGAICSGNNVVPRPNYWGFWNKGELAFHLCPARYCCSGTENVPCKVYNHCANNRTGTLCGSCSEGFSVSMLTRQCIPDSNCGGGQWFWFLAFLTTLAYAIWYTFKDDLMIFAIFCINKPSKSLSLFKKPMKKIVSCDCIRSGTEGNVSENRNVRPLQHALNGTSSENCVRNIVSENTYQNASLEMGYFGILTYFVQIASIMKIQIEFSDIDKSDSFVDQIVLYLETFLNLELTQFSFDVCPIIGLTMLGKNLYKLVFLIGIYLSWLGLFILSMTLLHATHGLNGKLLSLNEKLVMGAIEIIKYTYSGICEVIFTSLLCVTIGNQYVWFYDGNNICYEKWQMVMLIFGIVYAIPFPFVLYLGMKLLKEQTLPAGLFICCCLCPLFGIIGMFMSAFWRKSKYQISSNTKESNKDASEIIISVLQGPYKESENHMTIYWEAMVSLRRLIITGLTLVGNASIRMVLITAFSVVFLYQHVRIQPFINRASNHVEGLSQSLLIMVSVINLLKASLTDSGVVPTGPSVLFFKGLELIEKVFPLILISHIIYIETRHKILTQRDKCFNKGYNTEYDNPARNVSNLDLNIQI